MKEGYYWLNLSTINNSPFNGTGYVHVKTINGTPIQKAVGVSSGDIANRVKYDSGWTPWAQVAIKSDLSITQEGIPGMSEQIVLLYNHYFVAICIKLNAYSAENSGWKVITTLPNKFRPKITIDAVLIDNNVNSFNSPKAIAARVLKDGGLLVYNYPDHLTNVAPIGIIFYPL